MIVGNLSSIFHLPWPTSEYHQKSFHLLSIYPGRLQKIVGNLLRNFPYTFADILRSPEIFSSTFHLPRSISEILRDIFQIFLIFPCPTNEVRVVSRFYLGSELRIHLDIYTYSDNISSILHNT